MLQGHDERDGCVFETIFWEKEVAEAPVQGRWGCPPDQANSKQMVDLLGWPGVGQEGAAVRMEHYCLG